MTFSVVIPMYNRESVIGRAINSVLKQTCQDFEIVVVDDGSTDKSVETVKKIKDSRIKIVLQDNAGATAARNHGVLESKGRYVSFLDSDDEWFPTMLENQLKQYKSDSAIGCVYSDVNVVYNDGTIHPFGPKLGVYGDAYAKILKQGYMAPTSIVSAKRDLLLEVGLFDIYLPASQDDDICFKLAKVSKIAFIPEVMALMHLDTNNRISDSNTKVARGWFMLWCRYADDIRSLCGEKLLRERYLSSIADFASAKDSKLMDEAVDTYKTAGFKLNILHIIILRILFNSNNFTVKKISKKVFRNL